MKIGRTIAQQTSLKHLALPAVFRTDRDQTGAKVIPQAGAARKRKEAQLSILTGILLVSHRAIMMTDASALHTTKVQMKEVHMATARLSALADLEAILKVAVETSSNRFLTAKIKAKRKVKVLVRVMAATDL